MLTFSAEQGFAQWMPYGTIFQAWALAAGGDSAVQKMLEILENEITVSMGLLGITELGQLDLSYLRHVTPVTHNGVTSPFPSLEKLIRF